MSKEQRQKISNAQVNLNKKTLHNDDYKLSYWLYLDYFKEFVSSNWKDKKAGYRLNAKFMKIINRIKARANK